MDKIGKKFKVVFITALGIMLFSLCIFIGKTSMSQTEATPEASTAPQKEVKQEKPEAFIDPIEDSVTTKDRKGIFKVLSKLKTKVADPTLKSFEEIEFPFPKEDEEIKEAAAEATSTPEEETEVEAEVVEDKPEFSMHIPTIADETAVAVKTADGKIQANVFVNVFYKRQSSSIQIWRLTFEQKPEPNAKGEKDWIIKDKTIVKTISDLYRIIQKSDFVYSFSTFEFTHDRINVKYNDGYFITTFAGDHPIGGVILGKGEFSYDPPRQLAKDVTDSDNEAYQLMRYTGTKEVDKYTGGKTKLDKEPFEDGYIIVHPSRFSDYVKTADFKVITDKSKTFDLMSKSKKVFEDKFIFLTGQFADIKKSLYKLPGDDQKDVFTCAVKTKVYDWLSYEVNPVDGFWMGAITKEVILENMYEWIASKWEDSRVWALYDIKEQRENWTRAEQEHESKDRYWITHENMECKVNEKKQTDAEIKTRLTVKMMKDNIDNLSFRLSKKVNISAITDETGFAIPYSRTWSINVYPIEPYRIAQERKLNFYMKGEIARQITLNTYDKAEDFSPEWGYLKNRTVDLLIKTPKPLKALSVGGRIGEWEEGNYNVVYWKSDVTVMHWSMIYAPYQTVETTFDAPYGPIPFYIYYQTAEEISLQYALPWQLKYMYDKWGEWTTVWKGIYKLSLKMSTMKRVQDEMESVMNWLETLYGKYPYPKMSVTHKSVNSWYAQGFPSMLQFWGSTFLSDKELERFDFTKYGGWNETYPWIFAHEAGHQWWGNIVGWLRPEDQWLSEGFTEQQSVNYTQKRDGNDILLKKYIAGWKEQATDYDRGGPIINGGVRLAESYQAMTYGKSPYVMNMLRICLGEDAFMAIERQFIKIFAFKVSPTTNDFVEVTSRTLGEKGCMALFNEKDMNWYFNQWIYGMGIPEYSFAYEAYKAGDTWKAKCRVKVLNDILFKIRTRIWVHPKDGLEPYPVWVLLDKKDVQEFEIDLKGEPKKLVFNEYDEVLTRGVKTEKY